jgi:predicted nuclease with TOPRIM domain
VPFNYPESKRTSYTHKHIQVSKMHPDDHPISNPVTDPLNWLDLICDPLQRLPDMLSTNHLLIVLALLLFTCLYLALAASWACRNAESCRINKRFDDADGRSERLEKMFRPLEHVPKRMNDVEYKQDELDSRIDTVVTGVSDLQEKLQDKSKDDTPASAPTPTQDVGLAGSLAAIEVKVDQLINDEANNSTHQEYSEQAEKLIAVERKIDQLLEHLLTPPPPAPRLTTSRLQALDREPVLPVVQPLTLSGGEVIATTTPIIPPTPSLSVSVVAGQTLAPIEVSAAQIGLSSRTSTSTEIGAQPDDPVLASTSTQTVQADAIQELSVSGNFCQSTAPVYQVPKMSMGGISAIITEPIESFDATWVLNEQIEELTSDHEVMRDELFQAQIQAKNAQKLKVAAEYSAAKLAMEKVQLQEDLFQAKGKLAVAKEEHDTTRNELVKVQKQVEDIKTTAGDSVANLAEEKSQLHNELARKEIELQDAQESIDELENDKTTLDSQFCSIMDELDAQKKLTAETQATLEAVETDLAITTRKLDGALMEVDSLNAELDEKAAVFVRMADAGIDMRQFMNTNDHPIEAGFVDFEHEFDCDDHDIASPTQENKTIERPAVEVTSSIVAGLNADASLFALSSYAPHLPAVDETMKSETAKDAMSTDGAAPEITSRFHAGLEESTDATARASSSLTISPVDETTRSKIAEKEEADGAIVREETPVTKKVGLGMSGYAPTTPLATLGTSVAPPVQHETAVKLMQGLEKAEISKTGEGTATDVPSKIKPNQGLSKYAPKTVAAASVHPPAKEELSTEPVKGRIKLQHPKRVRIWSLWVSPPLRLASV